MKKSIDNYSFCYKGFMDDGIKSLPIGNGDIGANVWVSRNGDTHILVSKTDAWSELSRLLKVAHIVLKLTPNPFEGGADFKLSIADGVLTVSAEKGSLSVYADAFAPSLRLTLKSDNDIDARIELLNYRDKPFDPKDDFSNFFARGGAYGICESADTIAITEKGGLSQVHRNEESCYEYSLKTQDMDFYQGRERDPLLGHTFGASIYTDNAIYRDGALCADGTKSLAMSVFICSGYTNEREEMLSMLDDLYAKYGNGSDKGYTRHKESWRKFWEEAYIFAEGDDDAESVTRAFLYQRYMIHCTDRGNAPIKFNGSIFTAGEMQGFPGNYDARCWGGPYWFQNTRLPYWYLLSVGDYSSILPMFDMYLDMMPISMARCQHYFGHPGMLIPETVSHFGLYANGNYGFVCDDGVRRCDLGKSAITKNGAANRYMRYHFNGMLELSYMMLKYLKLSDDNTRRMRIFSFVEQALLFFDRHFDKIDEKLLITPVASLETWQVCANDLPDIAGLMAIVNELSLIDELPSGLKSVYDSIKSALPELPMKNTEEGELLLPCETIIDKATRNVENPELYAVFPFDLFGVGKPNIEIARLTYQKRLFRHDGGWSQDPIDAALLGLTEEAVRHVVRQSAMKDPRALFPAFWGPNFDETPDQDHGSVTALTLILMLLNTDGESFEAFPSWPEKWNVRFRLPINHARYVCGEQIDGERRVYEC